MTEGNQQERQPDQPQPLPPQDQRDAGQREQQEERDTESERQEVMNDESGGGECCKPEERLALQFEVVDDEQQEDEFESQTQQLANVVHVSCRGMLRLQHPKEPLDARPGRMRLDRGDRHDVTRPGTPSHRPGIPVAQMIQTATEHQEDL